MRRVAVAHARGCGEPLSRLMIAGMRFRRSIALAVALTAMVGACSRAPREPQIESISNVAQGTTYTIKWWTTIDVDGRALADAAEAELDRIDGLLSNFRPDSVIESFNTSRTVAIQELPEELVSLLEVAASVHRASAGCFDPTVRPLVRLWGFDSPTPQVPDRVAVERTAERVGFDKLEILDSRHVRKTTPDLEIDLASIGQAYSAGRLAALAEGFGLTNYVVEIGGELVARGTRPDRQPWRIGIEQPLRGRGPIERVIAMPAERTAVTTSGTYRQYFEAAGRIYSHILDPKTGQPVDHDLVSVTIIDSDPMLAGAWATALVCLGPERAALTADRETVAALMFVRAGDSTEERRSAALEAEFGTVLESP
jgi:FAD:protein FMN transferase